MKLAIVALIAAAVGFLAGALTEYRPKEFGTENTVDRTAAALTEQKLRAEIADENRTIGEYSNALVRATNIIAHQKRPLF